MLIQYSLSSSIEPTNFCLSDHGQQDLLCDWLPGAETWQMCLRGNGEFQGGCKRKVLISEDGMNVDHSCPESFPIVSSQLSTACSMSGSSPTNLVYKRRKLQGDSTATLPGQGQENSRRSGNCFSVVSCSTSSVVAREQKIALQDEHEVEAFGAPTLSSDLNSEFVNRCSIGKVIHKAPKSSVEKTLEGDSMNDSCSSSKSIVEHVLSSTKSEVDITSECSSSSAIDVEYMGEDLSEMEFCIHILRRHGLLGGDSSSRTCVSPEDTGTSNDGNNYRPCKICGQMETTIKLLICDQCEEAFHLSCCNPRVKKVPADDEWFCRSCVRKRCKISKEKVNRKLPNITGEMSGCKSLSSKGKTNHIALMLRDRKSYTTSVRIGKCFQADVPDWTGPIDNDDDGFGESLEMDPSEFVNSHELISNKPSKVSSVGNWLQCQQVVDGSGEDATGIICGKWRRAPFSEVQTDKWECFCSVRWDPTYADCAVPQEIETKEVLKQLKYTEKLRPRLSGKQQKSDHTNNNGNRNPHVGAESMQTP